MMALICIIFCLSVCAFVHLHWEYHVVATLLSNLGIKILVSSSIFASQQTIGFQITSVPFVDDISISHPVALIQECPSLQQRVNSVKMI